MVLLMQGFRERLAFVKDTLKLGLETLYHPVVFHHTPCRIILRMVRRQAGFSAAQG
jgi:hypothetical protein